MISDNAEKFKYNFFFTFIPEIEKALVTKYQEWIEDCFE